MTPHVIAEALQLEILNGALPPGTELAQAGLAERFGVSRIPIRDALHILAGTGLVKLMMNRGAQVTELSAEEIREVYDLRALLECDCLRRAAHNIAPSDLREIERVRRKSDIDAVTPAWSAGDREFHSAIYKFSNRARQLALINALRQTCEIHARAYSTMPEKRPTWLNDHANIVEHLRANDVEGAVRALRSHLAEAADHLIAKMEMLAT